MTDFEGGFEVEVKRDSKTYVSVGGAQWATVEQSDEIGTTIHLTGNSQEWSVLDAERALVALTQAVGIAKP